MYDTKKNDLNSGLGIITSMTKRGSEQFMLNSGYHLALEQRVSDLNFTIY
jgi:hypothetical protein